MSELEVQWCKYVVEMYSSPKVKTLSDFKILLWSKIGSIAFNLYRIIAKQKIYQFVNDVTCYR